MLTSYWRHNILFYISYDLLSELTVQQEILRRCWQWWQEESLVLSFPFIVFTIRTWHLIYVIGFYFDARIFYMFLIQDRFFNLSAPKSESAWYSTSRRAMLPNNPLYQLFSKLQSLLMTRQKKHLLLEGKRLLTSPYIQFVFRSARTSSKPSLSSVRPSVTIFLLLLLLLLFLLLFLLLLLLSCHPWSS